MVDNFIYACKILVKDIQTEAPKKRSAEEDLILTFIKKHKGDVNELLLDLKEATEAEQLKKMEDAHQRIIYHLMDLFPDIKTQISNLKIEYEKDGIPHHSSRVEYINEDESLNDLHMLYPKEISWSLRVSIKMKEKEDFECLFWWTCEVTQNWHTWSDKIYFQEPKYEHSVNILEYNALKEVDLSILQALHIGFATLEFLFDMEVNQFDELFQPLCENPNDWDIYCACMVRPISFTINS